MEVYTGTAGGNLKRMRLLELLIVCTVLCRFFKILNEGINDKIEEHCWALCVIKHIMLILFIILEISLDFIVI